jgi:cobalt/nickel transport system ATP-binding protein
MVGWGDGVKTVVTATHDLNIIEDIADHCFVFQNGRLVAEGSPTSILKDEVLLKKANLLHAHRHVHATGKVHSHSHLHRGHEH